MGIHQRGIHESRVQWEGGAVDGGSSIIDKLVHNII